MTYMYVYFSMRCGIECATCRAGCQQCVAQTAYVIVCTMAPHVCIIIDSVQFGSTHTPRRDGSKDEVSGWP